MMMILMDKLTSKVEFVKRQTFHLCICCYVWVFMKTVCWGNT